MTILVDLEIGIFKIDPSLVVDISLNSVDSGNSEGVIYVHIPALGDKNRNLLCFFVYLLFLGNPLGESDHIIHRWKCLDEEIAAPLKS